jgi:putative restriction endonuclease
VNVFVAVTDGEWFRFLAGQPALDEVNFWQPSPRTFRALQPGEPFLFKLHAPESFIAGGGFFVRWSPLLCSMAWEVFGLENGAATLGDMRRRVERYRRVPASSEDYEVGCIVLTQPFFFERADWLAPPEDFGPNVQTGKRYDSRRRPTGRGCGRRSRSGRWRASSIWTSRSRPSRGGRSASRSWCGRGSGRARSGSW